MKFTIFLSSLSLLFTIAVLCFSPVFAATPSDTLTPIDSLTTNQTLISAGGKFELGFFPIGNPSKYYLGIWYKDIPLSPTTFIWVANRDTPMTVSCTLKLGNQGNFTILDHHDGSNFRWSNSNKSTAQNPVLQLLDSGNLVVRETGDEDPANYIWQSFDYPTDTLVSGQKFGWNLETGLNRVLKSWRAQDDPGSGNYSLKMDYHGDPEFYLYGGDQKLYRSGPWVGQRFSGVAGVKPPSNSSFNFTFYVGSDEVYYSFEPPNDKVRSRFVVTYDGFLRRWTWVPETNKWTQFWYARKDQCDFYRNCGPHGLCNVGGQFVCQCPTGFEPANPQAWGWRDGSNGCVRKTKLDCGSDGFLRLTNMKLPETSTVFVNKSMSLKQCRNMCKGNCNCTAYANSEVIQQVGSGCVIWTDELTDMRNFATGGQDLYIRLAASDLDETRNRKIIVAVIVIASTAMLAVSMYFLWRWMSRGNGTKLTNKETQSRDNMSDPGLVQADFQELPLFDFKKLVVATNSFSRENKLGQGGFGPVYKGTLEDGQEIAVKRLSKASGQGLEEFMNEVVVISKLQHRNLVKLLGCCVEGEEKLLIYEYMPNKSLDALLFDPLHRGYLDWNKRFNIINGICRGLLYLHRDSRLKIIHRDLKAGNILLDKELNPKISDFGMARIFGGNQDQANTLRVVGTYGYMSPEYAMEGRFSEKSDVYSFGVLLLEIVSGQRSRHFQDDESMNLLAHAWKLWNEDDILTLFDPTITDPSFRSEISRCIQVGLLCVQEYPEDRPSMSTIISMLDTSKMIDVPHPGQPGFTQRKITPKEKMTASESSQEQYCSLNHISQSIISGR